MTRSWIWILVVLLVACQTTTEPAVLPTVADLNEINTEQAATAFAIATPTRRPLPPTFTPSPMFTATATDPAQVPTVTPEGFRTSGTLFYVFNGDAIVELAADGSFEDLLPIPHIGQDISGLSVSPNDTYLAYVAPGAGSAREVYVTDRQGSNTLQVSRLGFGVVQRPVWNSDGSALAFIAAQAPGTPMGIYAVNVDGSGQRPVVELPSTALQGLAWSADGRWLFFANREIYAADAVTGTLTEALTTFNGFGPDFAPIHHPVDPQLYYLKTEQDFETGVRGGILSFIDTNQLPQPPAERPGAKLYVNDLEYSGDGTLLLAAGDLGIWVQLQQMQTATKIVDDIMTAPHPTFSPDAEQVAYVNLDGLGVPQVFLVDRRGGDPVQLTFHQDGAITDLAWLRG